MAYVVWNAIVVSKLRSKRVLKVCSFDLHVNLAISQVNSKPLRRLGVTVCHKQQQAIWGESSKPQGSGKTETKIDEISLNMLMYISREGRKEGNAGMRNSSMGPLWRIDPTSRQGRKEMFYLTTYSTHILFTVIWRQTYGKVSLR